MTMFGGGGSFIPPLQGRVASPAISRGRRVGCDARIIPPPAAPIDRAMFGRARLPPLAGRDESSLYAHPFQAALDLTHPSSKEDASCRPSVISGRGVRRLRRTAKRACGLI